MLRALGYTPVIITLQQPIPPACDFQEKTSIKFRADLAIYCAYVWLHFTP